MLKMKPNFDVAAALAAYAKAEDGQKAELQSIKN